MVRPLHDPPDAVHQATSSQIASNKEPHRGAIAPRSTAVWGPNTLSHQPHRRFVAFKNGFPALCGTRSCNLATRKPCRPDALRWQLGSVEAQSARHLHQRSVLSMRNLNQKLLTVLLVALSPVAFNFAAKQFRHGQPLDNLNVRCAYWRDNQWNRYFAPIFEPTPTPAPTPVANFFDQFDCPPKCP